VAAKYLSIAFVVLLLSGLTFFYVLFARKMFSFPVLPELVALGGITFVGLCYGAMSLFASSLTDNPLIAFFVGIFFNIFIWLMGGFAELADSSMLKSIFDQISLNQHTQSLVGESVIRANGIVFYLSLIFLFCFLTERVVESSRWRS
jgi:ABC-2 type transport system permease protein